MDNLIKIILIAVIFFLINFSYSSSEIDYVFPNYQDVKKRITDRNFPKFLKNEKKFFEIIGNMLNDDTSIQKKKEAIECKINRINSRKQNNQQKKNKILIEKLKYFSFLKKKILTHIISLIDYVYKLEVKNLEEKKNEITNEKSSIAEIQLNRGQIAPADLAFSESEVASAKKKLVFAKLALLENKIKIIEGKKLDFIFDFTNDNNVYKVEELKNFFLKSNTELNIKKLEAQVEEKCNKKEQDYQLEKFKIEGLNKIQNIKNKIKEYTFLENINKHEIDALKINFEGVNADFEAGARTIMDVLNSMNRLQNAKLESKKIKAEILKSYYHLVFLTI